MFNDQRFYDGQPDPYQMMYQQDSRDRRKKKKKKKANKHKKKYSSEEEDVFDDFNLRDSSKFENNLSWFFSCFFTGSGCRFGYRYRISEIPTGYS